MFGKQSVTWTVEEFRKNSTRKASRRTEYGSEAEEPRDDDDDDLWRRIRISWRSTSFRNDATSSAEL